MKYLFLVLAALIMLSPGSAFAAGERPTEPVTAAPKRAENGRELELLSIATASGARHDFLIEAVSEPADMALGLGFRTELPAERGMLFLFPTLGPRSFWMKNTFIPLDILFLNPDGTIRNIGKNAQPHDLTTVSSDGPVLHVLELNGGTADRLGIAAGDTVHHPVFGNALAE